MCNILDHGRDSHCSRLAVHTLASIGRVLECGAELEEVEEAEEQQVYLHDEYVRTDE